VIFCRKVCSKLAKGGHFVYLPQILSFHKMKAYERERERENSLPSPSVFFGGKFLIFELIEIVCHFYELKNSHIKSTRGVTNRILDSFWTWPHFVFPRFSFFGDEEREKRSQNQVGSGGPLFLLVEQVGIRRCECFHIIFKYCSSFLM
jgi:hypothetical protein